MTRSTAWLVLVALVGSAVVDSSLAARVAHAQAPISATPTPRAPSAAPEDPETVTRAQAKVEFQAGVAAYDAERYEEALKHFQEAFRIKPHPSVRVNMANCYERLGKPLQAIFHFERFLEDNSGASDQRREVMEALRGLRAKVSEVTLRITPDGASVTIDEGERRQAPILEPVRLEAGLHLIEVALSGYETVKREVLLNGGQPTELAITLDRAQAVAAAPVPDKVPAAASVNDSKPVRSVELSNVEPLESEDAERAAPATEGPAKSLLPTVGWVSGGVTVGLLVAALVTGQLALSAEADFENSRETVRDTTSSPIDRREAFVDALDAADRADALALTSDVLLGASLFGAAATVYIAIRHHGRESRSPANGGAQTALVVGPASAALRGTF